MTVLEEHRIIITKENGPGMMHVFYEDDPSTALCGLRLKGWDTGLIPGVPICEECLRLDRELPGISAEENHRRSLS